MNSPKPRNPKKDFSQEWKGTHGGVPHAGTFVARTQDEWEKLWNATHSSQFPIPKAPKLPKDKMAVGIFTGQSSSPRDISVTRIEETAGQTTVHWKAQGSAQSGGGMMGATVMHDPFLLKFIEKTEAPVRFAKETLPAQTGKPAYSAPGDLKKLPQGPRPF